MFAARGGGSGRGVREEGGQGREGGRGRGRHRGWRWGERDSLALIASRLRGSSSALLSASQKDSPGHGGKDQA